MVSGRIWDILVLCNNRDKSIIVKIIIFIMKISLPHYCDNSKFPDTIL